MHLIFKNSLGSCLWECGAVEEEWPPDISPETTQESRVGTCCSAPNSDKPTLFSISVLRENVTL